MEVPDEFVSQDVKTFQFQNDLPSLPQPDLDNTLDKYLASVRAVTTDGEYRQTEFIVNSFRAGVGKTLHEKFLLQIANQRNWLEKLWEQKSYLEGRYPSAPFVNISGTGPYYSTVWPGSQAERAAIVLYTNLLFWKLLRTEQLQPDMIGKEEVACMNQYTRLFNSCKRPGLTVDTLNYFFKIEAEGACPSHVVVICKGRFFKMEVVHSDGELLTQPELTAHFCHIRKVCDQEDAAPGLGALTGDNRTNWAQNRDHLLSLDPLHADHIQDIETAIMVFVLDEEEPQDVNELAHAGLTGNPGNRWFDKSINQVIFKNGLVAGNCDHAPFDGLVYIYVTAFSELCIAKSAGTWKGSTQVRPVAPPTELVFQYDDKLLLAITEARNLFNTMASEVEVYYQLYHGYGKSFIRSFKQHPDAYVQMALQLAYYRMYRKPVATYETSSLRRFYHGRTETVRSCTVEATQWAQTMLDPAAKIKDQIKLFSIAIQKHIENMMDASNLKGCDRHLLALATLADEEGLPTPEIFTDASYKKSGGSGNFILSTSFIGYTPVLGGCAPMCDHGYGFFYSIQGDRITFYITSWVRDEDTDGRQLFASVCQSLNVMRELLETTMLTEPKL